MSNRIIERVLNDVSLDPRIKDGTFKIEENEHMDVLRDYLQNKGIEEGAVIEFTNKVLEGKYPERQAYNAKGILVTFPTPEYKKDAISRGTHFEEDPTKGQSNLWQNSQAQSPAPKEEPKKDAPKGDVKTSLPVSQSTPSGNQPNDNPAPSATPPEQPQTTAAPQQAGEEENEEPAPEPTELPPPTPKSPQEKEADKNAIKQMLQSDELMLERVCEWIVNHTNTPLLDILKKK